MPLASATVSVEACSADRRGPCPEPPGTRGLVQQAKLAAPTASIAVDYSISRLLGHRSPDPRIAALRDVVVDHALQLPNGGIKATAPRQSVAAATIRADCSVVDLT